MVLPEWINTNLEYVLNYKCYGICTDYPQVIRNIVLNNNITGMNNDIINEIN